MKIAALLLLLIMSGCTVVQPRYIKPNERGSLNKNNIEVNKSYDVVWQSLIEYSSRSYFSTKNVEKDAGLLTLSFGSSRPGKYVDCGKINSKNMKHKESFLNAAKTSGTVELMGTMSLSMKSIDAAKTSVSVNSSYILDVKEGDFPKQTWSFDTNGKQSKKFGELVITCRSTLVAEIDIISRINLISQGH